MTESEAVKIVAYIVSRCPSMRLEDTTTRAWYDDLANLDYRDCQHAAWQLTRTQPYVALCELLEVAAKITDQRIGKRKRAELDAEIQAEDQRAIEGPAQPFDRGALLEMLRRGAARHRVPTVDRRSEDTRRREVQAELDRIREQVSPHDPTRRS